MTDLALRVGKFVDAETNFDTQAMIAWANEHSDFPIFFCSIYLAFIFYVPGLIKDQKAWSLRRTWALWNLTLSLFSIIGVVRTLPVLLGALREHGFRYSVCKDPATWFLSTGPCGMWVTAFIFSKVPELLDTFFLVLQKKPVIFLHWFHHVTVLLYCWHAYSLNTGPGLWFAALNYSVHSIMYFYYFLSISGGKLRHFARPIAPFITAIQLLQMVAGSTIIAAAAYYHGEAEGCAIHPSNYRLGLAMYLSYLILFGALFYNLYLKPGGKHNRPRPSAPKNEDEAQTICGVELKSEDNPKGDDAAGFFHGRAGQDRRVSSYETLCAANGQNGKKKQ